MDSQPRLPSVASPTPAVSPPAQPPAVAQPLAVVWPRSVQMALGALLALAVLALAGRCLLQSLGAGTGTVPSQRVNLNTANHAELLLLPGIGEALAERITKARAQAPFQRVDDLRKVAGIGPATLERLRLWVYVADVPTAARQPALQLTVEPAARPGSRSRKPAPKEPIDVNTADAAQLMRIPGIGPVLSQRIIAERERSAFQTVAELRRVKGIGPKTLDKIAPFIIISPRPDPGASPDAAIATRVE
jgi:competence protein ComEA